METLKQLLAFPVYATVAWLVWVLGQQVGPAGLFAALIGLVLVGFAAWSFSMRAAAGAWGRRVAAPARSPPSLGGVAVAAVAPASATGAAARRSRHAAGASSPSRRPGSTSCARRAARSSST